MSVVDGPRGGQQRKRKVKGQVGSTGEQQFKNGVQGIFCPLI